MCCKEIKKDIFRKSFDVEFEFKGPKIESEDTLTKCLRRKSEFV